MLNVPDIAGKPDGVRCSTHKAADDRRNVLVDAVLGDRDSVVCLYSMF